MTAELLLMASLAEHRRDQGLTLNDLASRIGVVASAISQWEKGGRSPRWPYVVSYASHVRRRVVVWDGITVLAEGPDVPAALRGLRKSAGLALDVLACRLHVTSPAVAMLEGRPRHRLVTVERYVTVGLRLQLTHLAAA